ncbi:hypothetical protein CCACVL1_25828 [Corchorus capsularis]|uniref:Uncharacterized protein n=1 Tax=Corchorus capsularis TaxID=210143 RepID=A0A1R3GGZ8_COCAP|nr:hypothetical protein CCACVL1_25828 [Corchorus capsularis]
MKKIQFGTALYGRRVARALQFEEASSEINSRMNGNPVRQQPNLKEGQGQRQQRGNGGNVAAGLTVDSTKRGILSKMRAALKDNFLVEGECDSRVLAVVNDVESSNNSQFPDDYIPLIDNMESGSFIGAEIIGAQSILGVGLSSIGPISGAIRSKSMGLQAELQRRANAKSGPTVVARQQRANNVHREMNLMIQMPPMSFVQKHQKVEIFENGRRQPAQLSRLQLICSAMRPWEVLVRRGQQFSQLPNTIRLEAR